MDWTDVVVPERKPSWRERVFRLFGKRVSSRMIDTETSAWDLGLFAAEWNLWWRFLWVRHYEGDYSDDCIGPRK